MVPGESLRRSIEHSSRRASRGRRSGTVGFFLVVVMGAVSPAPAQENGRIVGTVLETGSGVPLRQVQVSLPGTGLGTLTRQDGQFIILEVPPGTYEVVAQRIGMGSAAQEVTVVAGDAVEVTFELETQALGLDEIVVTGTAGQARRREVGSSISQVDLQEMVEPVMSVAQALAAQSPGMLSLRSSGMAGSGSQIRLRGNVSVSMSNQPLIYIDGVRMQSDGLALNHAVGHHVAFGPKEVIGPLNDINPNDIERIEIVKGPAATALYGTEAAGGVIQIFTRRGTSGDVQWTAQTDQGVNWVQPFGPDNAPYMRLGPWLRNAHQQSYNLSVRGGAGGISYYASARRSDSEGVLPNDYDEKWLFRGNFGFQPFSNLDLQWNTAITRQHVENSPSGSSPYSLPHNAYHRAPGRPSNYVFSSEFDVINRLLEYEITTNVNRVVTGLTTTYSPTSAFTNRLTLGLDRLHSDMRNIRPYGYVNHPQGAVSTRSWTNDLLTADYVGTYDWRLTNTFRASLSWGGQAVVHQQIDVGATGDVLPGPGEHTVNSGADIVAQEERLRTINAGFFAQSLFDLNDRYFLTLALRVDGNSAFGEGFGLQPYPRATFSYVVSDEPFWPASLGEVKLRAAYGHAGRAPGAFDAVRTWTPTRWLEQSAFEPRNVGNSDLGPERTVEIETGFDATLFDERLSVQFTYYNQETRDALIPVQQIPTLGFLGSQLENVGVLGNSGIETDIDAAILQSRALSWNVGVGVYTNHSETKDLGGAAPFSVSGGGWLEEGHPVPAVRYDRLLNPDELAEPEIERDYIWGPNQPTHTFNIRTSLSFANGIRVSARGEFQGGHYIYDRATSESANRGSVVPFCDDIFPIEEAARDRLTALERYMCDDEWQATLVYPADFFRVRNLGLEAPIPFRIPGTSSAIFIASVQNFWTWLNDDFLAMDPEIAGNEGMSSGVTREIWEQPPPPASFRASLRISF